MDSISINKNYPFLHTIFELRKHEDFILYNKIAAITIEEDALVLDLLEEEYTEEKTGYPYVAPGFDGKAALWAAKTIYHIAQLILYRQTKETEIPKLLPEYEGNINASAILSADLCLRFLPQLLQQIKNIEPDDILIDFITNILIKWHYSGIGTEFDSVNLDFAIVFENASLKQLYTDRIMLQKDKKLALSDAWKPMIDAALGIHKSELWKELEH